MHLKNDTVLLWDLFFFKSLSRVQLFVTPWAIAYQAPLSMGFSRQEYWTGVPFPSPGDLPYPGIEPGSPTLHAMDSLLSKPQGSPQVALVVKNLPANAGHLRGAGSIPGLGRSAGEENGNLLQYSCLENPMDREA